MSVSVQVSVGQYTTAGRKPTNEDCFGVGIPELSLIDMKGIAMVIADGMTASEGARVASEMCVRTMMDDYFATHSSWTVKTSVGRVLTATNRWLYNQGISQFQAEHSMVATFSGLVLKAGVGYLFHVGDSQIAIVRGAQLEILTRCHRVHLRRGHEALNRGVGMAPELAVDYREVNFSDGDVLVFTTDGVHDHLSGKVIADTVAASADDLNRAAQTICEAALNAGSDDNLSCQIVRIDAVGKRTSNAIAETLRVLPFPPDLLPGQIFEGWRILRELYSSSRSQVYLAEEMVAGRRVAIKTPSLNHVDDQDYIRQFVREEWVGQLIDSPHVIQVIPSTQPRRFLYTLMEHVDGKTLSQWMTENPKPSVEAVRNIIQQMVRALRALHRNEILHQDIKPDNVMIRSDGFIKIIDFGSVRIAGLEELKGASPSPQLMGTREYIAPEYLRGETPTARSDLYSIGVLTYQLLTGKHPYSGGFSSVKELGSARYIPAAHYNPEVPAFVDFAIERAVQLSPLKRQEELDVFMVELIKPGDNFVLRKRRNEPLIQSHPRAVYALVLMASLALNAVLAYLLFAASV